MEDAVAVGCPQLAEEAEAWLAGRIEDRAGFLGGEPDVAISAPLWDAGARVGRGSVTVGSERWGYLDLRDRLYFPETPSAASADLRAA
eukprot:5885654-Lingulodinium_polyedra.AAC.1